MKKPWIYLLLLVILPASLLAACYPGGAASGGLNCSYGGEVCVNLSTVKTFAMGEAVPLIITVTSSKDFANLSITIDTGAEIEMDGPKYWEKNISNPTIDRGVAYWGFAINAGQPLTFNRMLHFPSHEGIFHIIVEVVNTGRTIDAVDSFYVLLTRENGGQVSMQGTPLPPYTPYIHLDVYGPGTPAPSPLTNPTYPPMLTSSPMVTLVATSVLVAPAYPAPPAPTSHPDP